MAEEQFFDRLNRIFSTALLLKRAGEKRIKVIDINKLQTYAKFQSNRFVDKYSGLRTNSGMYEYMGQGQMSGFQLLRSRLYLDYELMDQDSILCSALDIYAEEATMKSEYGDILTIKSTKQDIIESLENLFYDVLNIEFNLWPWVRNLVKYGDLFLKLDIVEKLGVTNVYPLTPYAVLRIEDPLNPQEVKFMYDATYASPSVYLSNPASSQNQEFKNYEIAHFRILSDSNYLPYGKSMLEGARKTWKQLILMEDAMLIHRIMRAPEKRVFKIDVGAIPPTQVDAHMERIINKIKKIPYVDEQTGQYNLKFNLQNMLEDFYVPVRGANSGTSIDSLGGMEFTGIEDINYLKNKMFAALKIPKAFLGYEEEINAKSTLAAEDVRFARTVERIQRIVVSELTKIAIVHLYTQGFNDDDLANFDLSLTPSSTIHEQEKVELWKQKTELASSIAELHLLPSDWVYENVFNISEEERADMKEKLAADAWEKWRLTQISEQGNDPKVTKQSVGSEFDSEEDPPEDGGDEESDATIKPEAVLKKDMTDSGLEVRERSPRKPVKHGLKAGFNGGSPLALEELYEARDARKKVQKERKKMIEQTLSFYTHKKTFLDEDISLKGTFLDENGLDNL